MEITHLLPGHFACTLFSRFEKRKNLIDNKLVLAITAAGITYFLLERSFRAADDAFLCHRVDSSPVYGV